MSNNKITDEGAIALSALFSGKHPIKRLNVEANKVKRVTVYGVPLSLCTVNTDCACMYHGTVDLKASLHPCRFSAKLAFSPFIL